MKVKYYLCNNKEIVLDRIEKELCVMGISYVRINNEIHFLDEIIRILDKEDTLTLVGNYNKLLEEKEKDICSKINKVNKIIPQQKKLDYKKESNKVNLLIKRNRR